MNKILISLLFSVPAITTTSIICQKQGNDPRQEPTTYHMRAEQMVHADGSDVNTDIDTVRWHDVNFEQTFKKIYLSGNSNYIEANKTLISTKQTNINTNSNSSGTCSANEHGWDLDNRIHDWTNEFRDNLYIHFVDNSPNFGYSKQRLYLKQKAIWYQKNDFHSITTPTMFGHLYEHANDIKFNVGIHRNFTTGKWNLYGVNKVWLKETPHIAVVYNWVDRFIWTLNAGDAPHEKNVAMPTKQYSPIKTDEGGVEAAAYNLDHLVEIVEPNYENKSIKIELNKRFLAFIKEWHDGLKDKPNQELTEQQRKSQQEFNLTTNDDPWSILGDIHSFLTFNIEYKISDPLKINEFKTERLNISYDSLISGTEIHLNKNQNNQYLIQFLNISTQEIDTPEIYIQENSTKTITQNNKQINENDNHFFELSKPSIQNIFFKEPDTSITQNIYPSSLDDNKVLKTLVSVVDSYGGKDDYSLIETSMYKIIRNDEDGSVFIQIDVGDIHLKKTFNIFKKSNKLPLELDASKAAYNIIGDELNGEKVEDIFLSNGYSESIIKELNFNVSTINDIDGVANIEITNGNLKGKQYSIKNLQPYFINIKKDIRKKYLKVKPSTVNINNLKERYLDISNEFWSRNQESLAFTLEPNNTSNILVVRVSYYEDFSHKYNKLDLSIQFYGSKNNNLVIWPTLFGAMALISMGAWIIYRRKIKYKILK